jgi:PAS domain S-box-containing protein
MDNQKKTKAELIEELAELRRRNSVLETARTQWEQAAAETRQSFSFFQAMLDHLPLAVFVKDARPDQFGRFVFWNTACEKLFGITKDQSLGRTVFDLHPPEQAAFFEQKDREAVARGVTVDIPEEPIDSVSLGLRLLHTIKAPLADDEGRPRYLLGVSEDVTERKEAEAAMRQLAGRILTAQEAERRLLAREMHDDLTQRLAVLAIDAAGLERLCAAPSPLLDGLGEMKEQLIKLSRDVHALSRQLHPSILDDLGLVDALRSECSSFSQREGIAVRYVPHDIRAGIPKELALCLYRIAQEGLRNVAKHARAKRACVSLAASDEGLLLSIEDAGVGFQPAGVHGRGGLGLASMEERARLVGGDFAIRSEPGKGTVIEVFLPCPGRTP